MKKQNTIFLIKQSLIAAIYASMTILLAPISYGDLQFRISELLLVLLLFNPRHIVGLSVGCFVANFFSPFFPFDLLYGTLATIISGLLMFSFRKAPPIALLMPSIANGIIVGVEIAIISEIDILATMLSVFVGEFVVVTIFGLGLYYIIRKNRVFLDIIK